jgi:hypothetical protein
MAKCIIEGCQNYADNNFGVRLRRPNTTAIFAPNTDAFVCDEHSKAGMRIDVTLKITGTRSTTTVVSGGGSRSVTRKKRIR